MPIRKHPSQFQIVDLSHPITQEPACSFRTGDTIPKFSFAEDDPNGLFYITTHIDNLAMNVGTHLTCPGAILNNTKSVPIGDYPLTNFVGDIIILDYSEKFEQVLDFFNQAGCLNIDFYNENDCYDYLVALDSLTVTKKEYKTKLAKQKINSKNLKGILFYTGLSRFWRNKKFEAWDYMYFLGLNLAIDLCMNLLEDNIYFVGIDSFQIGHPIINFTGQEKPFVLSKKCQHYIAEKISFLQNADCRKKLLTHNIFLYENLNIPSTLINQRLYFFGIPLNIKAIGMDNASIVRPCVKI